MLYCALVAFSGHMVQGIRNHMNKNLSRVRVLLSPDLGNWSGPIAVLRILQILQKLNMWFLHAWNRDIPTSIYVRFVPVLILHLLLSHFDPLDPSVYPHFDIYPAVPSKITFGDDQPTKKRAQVHEEQKPFIKAVPWRGVWPYQKSSSLIQSINVQLNPAYPVLNICTVSHSLMIHTFY